ncbi:hypothetical protein LC048_07475 [Mesobacillus subterraneus]|uniref:hypothetical protein n=1 Tax=Mesobacillus TaxID=2675231 RepID=UPI000C83C023|nr:MULTISPECIES: hypothetical protein [Mesobacillus]WLR56716.1 hypothetical protein LC048_07475 [Mesobacillus subterraneus]
MRYVVRTCLLILLVSLTGMYTTSSVDAAKINNKTINEVNAQLLELGYPKRLLDRLPIEEKLDIVNGDEIAEFVGAKTTYFGLDNEVLYVDDYSEPFSPVLPEGTINSMTVSQYASRLVDTSYRDRFELRTTHQWTISPVWRRTDMVGYAWDGNKFNLVPGTHYISVGGNGINGAATYSSKNLYNSSFTGAGWSFPMPTSGDRPVAMTKIQIQEVSPISGSSQFHSLYVHTKDSSGTIGLNYGIFNVSFTGNISNDQRAEVVNFNH